MLSPCTRCTRVKKPRLCDNKDCRDWQQWFIESWNAMRAAPRLEIEKTPRVPEGVCIGGRIYALPHRIDSYLQTDPCAGCLCPRDLCVIPCRVKRDWLRARQEVLQ